ncbi:MAG: hypothetical protein KME60_28845 [Cyanomargarita calcarea GSE-NOS-MK-12-04C]|uniref:Uncharacterized protein n=1 Tax=Cyanomargarita calcarea GSE-NOS-MK-12-04C TaxID=2839659 RepID=A0A951UVU4_9CYAN|nr:hypothetical protein [Cyanomargarita calcarea GSE-NOS-MK-12-04C]
MWRIITRECTGFLHYVQTVHPEFGAPSITTAKSPEVLEASSIRKMIVSSSPVLLGVADFGIFWRSRISNQPS